MEIDGLSGDCFDMTMTFVLYSVWDQTFQLTIEQHSESYLQTSLWTCKDNYTFC